MHMLRIDDWNKNKNEEMLFKQTIFCGIVFFFFAQPDGRWLNADAKSCLGASVGGFLCIGGATLVLGAGFTGARAGSIAIAPSSALVRSAFAA